MIVERIIFNVVAFALFFIVFFKMIHKNDTSYIYALVAQVFGIAVGFVGLIFCFNFPVAIYIITYIVSVILPFFIVMLEKRGIYFSEIIFLNVARFYYKAQKTEKAKETLKNILDKYPNSYFLHKQLAKIYEETGNIDIAVDEYIRAWEINKLDYDLPLKTSILLKGIQRNEEAIYILNDLLKRKPENYDASCLLGDILYEQEKYREAVNVYLQALNYNPDKFELYYNLGMVYTRLNDFQSAKEYYEKAAKLNSLLYHAKYDLGQIALLYNELEEAEEYFTQCIDDDDLVDEVYYYLAYIYMLKGDRDKAIQYLNIAVQDNKELYKKANKELVFKMIVGRISKPINTSEYKNKKKLTLKEIETFKHLEKTCEIVGSLSQNDIKAIKLLRRRQQEKERE